MSSKEVFNWEANDDSDPPNPRKKIACPYPENGNILEWDESRVRKNHSVDYEISRSVAIKRRDPNFSFRGEVEETAPKGIKRVSCNLQVSSDNTLKYQ